MRLPNGYGSVSKLSGRRRRPYMIRDGNGVVMGYAKTREEGLEILATVNRDPEKYKRSQALFKDVFDLLLKYGCNGLVDKTVNNFRSQYKKCSMLYDKKYSELRLVDFLKVIEDSGGGLGAKRNLRNFFRKMDSVAYQFDITDKEYTSGIPTYPQSVETKRTPFSEDEIKILWNNLDIEDVDFVLILIYTGMRMGEIGKLEKKNIHLKDSYLIGGSKTQAGKNRTIPIHEKIKPLIENRLKLSTKNTLFNIGDKSLRVRFKKAMNKLGMEHIPHECRHTLRTRLDNINVNPIIIDRILGHKSVGGTGANVYTHKDINQLIEAINRLE